MIPEIYKDNTTIRKNHTEYTHLFCVLIRITIGSLIILDKIPVLFVLLLSLFVIGMFSYKYFKLKNVWKVYLRTILIYSLVGISAYIYKEKYNNINGLLIIIDALMGLQSRHHFDRLGLLIK
jgi:hypothetical protein